MNKAVRMNRWGLPTPATPRRAMVAWTAKLACGAALAAALVGPVLLQPVAAQDDDTITLSAGGSTLVVSPGTADAYSAVAEAHAAPGYAETDAAGGVRAVAISNCGAMTQAAAAEAIARPDEGAKTVAEGGAALSDPNSGDSSVDNSLAVTDPKAFADQLNAEIRANNDALQMNQGDDNANSDASADGAKDGKDPVQAIANNRKDKKDVQEVTPETCPKEEKEVQPPPAAPEAPAPEAPVVVEVPVTGTGLGSSQLASLFAAASLVSGLGSLGLGRLRRVAVGSIAR
jgi:hypothetical protein